MSQEASTPERASEVISMTTCSGVMPPAVGSLTMRTVPVAAPGPPPKCVDVSIVCAGPNVVVSAMRAVKCAKYPGSALTSSLRYCSESTSGEPAARVTGFVALNGPFSLFEAKQCAVTLLGSGGVALIATAGEARVTATIAANVRVRRITARSQPRVSNHRPN